MNVFVQIICESKSKSLSAVMSLAGIQESNTVPYTSPENAGLEHSHQVLLNLLGTQSRRLHRDCMSILYYMCTMSPGILLQDSFCTGLFSEENPNQVEDNEHHRLQEAARSYCTTVASTYPHKTHQQEEGVMLLRFPLRTSWLETQLSLININDRWETARACP